MSVPALRELRPKVPARRRRVRILGLLLGVVALALVCAASLAIGSRSLAPNAVFDALVHYRAGDAVSVIVVDSRLPRTVLGIIVGCALGLAGGLMQGLTRNPLADPGILGVNVGASLAVVVGIAFLGITAPAGYIWLAFGGAAIASVLVYGVAALGREGATPVKLALAGAAVTAGLGSLITAVLLTNASALDTLRFWQVGALAGRSAGVAAQVLPTLAIGAVLALCCGRMLNSLALGDDIARGLGQRVGVSRAVVAIAIVLLCGSATAAAGPISFVGLIVPHVARRIVGSDYRWILPYSALLASVLLLGCDVIGRVLLYPGELQVGIVTALIGAPVFIGLVRRGRAIGL